MGASSTGASSTGSTATTIYILMHNFIILYRAGFNLLLLKRAKKWYQTYLVMWSIFGVKLNDIVIFEKSCNSSTLLMELFMICGLMAKEGGTGQMLKLVFVRNNESELFLIPFVSYQ